MPITSQTDVVSAVSGSGAAPTASRLGTAVVFVPKVGDPTQKNREKEIGGGSVAGLSSKLTNRFDDPTYYQ